MSLQPETNTPTKLRHQAYESFSELLLTLQIRPGQFLTQRELVAITDMPLGAIRELIPRLEADGLIKTIPQRGLQVAYIDMDLIRNAYQLRNILEKEAAHHFAIHASQDDISKLRDAHLAIIDQATTRITPELIEQAQQIDWHFHDTIIDALGNEIISNIYRVNSIKVRLIRAERSRIKPELIISVIKEHMAIIEAFEKRDTKLAVKALEAHIESARNRAFAL